jgi:hypothetical protein
MAVPPVSNDDFGTRHGRGATGRGGRTATSSSTSYGTTSSRIDANETQIEGAGVNLLSYIAPGDEHVVLSDGLFYTETVNGVLFVDWVAQLVNHQPGADVHCQECRAG